VQPIAPIEPLPEETMHAAAHRSVPQQLSVPTRAGIALAAVAMIAGSVLFAAQASELAVRNAEAAINPTIRYVMLPNVEVTASRSAALADACAAPVRAHTVART
jgi:hypothetical protein